ncbi:hypothetical protein CAPTEDRAFT_176382 [Capitella teleta]|uniref:carbonyl reductase (NADPH) n=1 Tax=Capitella teleta TaxID=283909 RepID=R7V9C5_CAPTE|nr:hypothetical protein CAPTEDRAFT_176382 [Capitella teleta]|eukprot:ELU15453.1 hypothetical protein CAPTEDRAFT_176382 [Capitella teleta]
MSKVAVVTGSNKGIGYAIVRGLCKKFDGDVFLTARDEGRGKNAVAELNKEGLNPKFHQLDIEDKESVERLAQFMKAEYGGVDILVNNAGFAFKNAATEPVAVQAEVTVDINYFGTLNVINAMMPILKPGARMVNVSSIVSQWTLTKSSPELREKMLASKTIEDVTQIMRDFVSAAKDGSLEQKGYTSSSYGNSKVGISLLTPILQAAVADGVLVNACCPGYVDTDMSSHKGHKTIDQGADTPLYLALLPPNSQQPKGAFVSEQKVVDWTAPSQGW